MKFVVDAQLPPALAEWLRDAGREAMHVQDIGMRDAPDSAIREYVAEGGFVLVTKDRDFVPSEGPSAKLVQVLWVRTGNMSNREVLRRLKRAWPRIIGHLEAGARIVELR